jgi:hypothetical protein
MALLHGVDQSRKAPIIRVAFAAPALVRPPS